MANSYTTTYSLTKPEVGAAEDQWGDLLNTNFDAIDDILDGTTPVTGIDINGGTIDGVTIGATSAPTVTNLGSVATADINGGTIDGTVIGGTTPAAITGTTLTATSSATLQHSASTKLATTSTGVDVTGTVTADGLTVEAVSDPTLQIKSTKDGTWAIGEALGSLDFYSSDSSGVGAGVKSSITSIAESTGGTIYGMGLFTYDGSSLYERLRVAYNGDISFYEDTGTTPKLFWDASAEALGIGTTSPTNILTVSTNGSTTPAINTFNAGNAAPITSYSARAGLELISYQSASGSPYTKTSALIANSDGTVPSEMQFWTKTNGQSSPAERLRIDSSGNLLVGKTVTTYATTGCLIKPQGHVTNANAEAFAFHRTGSDGNILNFSKDGTTVGSIGAEYSTLNIDGGSGAAGIHFAAASLTPRDNGTYADAGVDLGTASYRFRNLYLSGGVYLGGTGAANLLDDYEEGTWTPTGNSGITINSVQHGTYVKVGKSVFATAWIKVNPTSANIQIGGLPFSESGRATASISNATQAQVITNQIAGTTFFIYGAATAGTNDDMFISISYHTNS